MLKQRQSFVDCCRQQELAICETDKRCIQHADKDAEYFCRDCLQPVCVRCMYFEHQAHSLCQMEDVLMVVYKEFELLYKKIRTANHKTKDYVKVKQQLKDKYAAYKEVQIQYIEDGFAQIIKKLKQRKTEMVLNFIEKYDNEIKNIEIIDNSYKDANKNLFEINKNYNKYKLMFDTFWQQAFLRKYREVQTFIQESLATLEFLISGFSINNPSLEPKHELNPWSINVEKAVQLIGNFKIEPKNKSSSIHASVSELPPQNSQTVTFKKVLRSLAKFPKPK